MGPNSVTFPPLATVLQAGLDAVPFQAAVSDIRTPSVLTKWMVGPLTLCRDTLSDEEPWWVFVR